MITEFKYKFNPEEDKLVLQSKSTNANPPRRRPKGSTKMHLSGIILVLLFSRNANPINAEMKPKGKLLLLVHSRKINSLITDDYNSNNHPISTLSDAAQHLVGKSLFCKPDCSQVYHCLQMAEQQPVELLECTSASRTFAFKRRAQGLSRSVSAFQVSCLSTWTHLSRLTNLFNTYTIKGWLIKLTHSPNCSRQKRQSISHLTSKKL